MILHFLFVRLMLKHGCIRQNGSCLPRIIVVSSESHRNPGEINWSSFGKFEPYGMGKAMQHYSHNKLLLTTLAVELSRRLNRAGTGHYSVFAVCPGPVSSNIARESPKIFHPLLRMIFSIFFKSPEKAAVPVIYLDARPDMEGKPFDYFFLMSRKKVDEKAWDPENGKRLWDLSEDLARKMGIEFNVIHCHRPLIYSNLHLITMNYNQLLSITINYR
jgi:NAD(P)-dependent dehydrogenase (short-subunit alcohol dehydrogenase family)